MQHAHDIGFVNLYHVNSILILRQTLTDNDPLENSTRQRSSGKLLTLIPRQSLLDNDPSANST